ncbi:MAG: class I SAM-dependent methyltransferase [Pseudomonadota bacterium]
MTNSIAELRAIYDAMDWHAEGEQWAERWGGTQQQWDRMVLPRIAPYLAPARHILELGGGMGRFSSHLARQGEHLWITEIATLCHTRLETKFRDMPTVTPLLTNGIALDRVPRNAVDFVFSVFSLVHADLPTLRAMLAHIKPRLRADGVIFLHHSNAATLAGGSHEVDRKLARYRALSVSAKAFRQMATRLGLRCVSQEVFGWDKDSLPGDCFSALTLPGSRWDRPYTYTHTRRFCAQAATTVPPRTARQKPHRHEELQC